MKQSHYVLVFRALTTLLSALSVYAEVSPTGCSYTQGQGRATCDFSIWNPPLADSQFSPGTVSEVIVQNVNGNIPPEAFSGLDGPNGNTNSLSLSITLQCSLEDVVILENAFTSNLNWIKTLAFENCYIREGISSNRLSNLSALETLTLSSGIVGPLTDSSFAGLSSLKSLLINSDFLDSVLPAGLFHPLTSAKIIDLRASGLSSISFGSLSGLTNLQTLDLSENTLTTLPYGLFNALPQLTTVTLTSNSWDCTCDMSWLSTWALYAGVTIDVVCATPSSLAGLTLNQAILSLGCSGIFAVSRLDYHFTFVRPRVLLCQNNQDSSDDDTAKLYAYIGLGVAGLACVMSGILACVLCCMCNSAARRPGAVLPHNTTYRKPPKHPDITQTSTTSRNEPRPPSYNSVERLFVPTQSTRPTPRSKDPYINVDYGTNF